jgi:Ca2+-transporting ATPase
VLHSGDVPVWAISFAGLSPGALVHGQTMAFLVLSFSQLAHALNMRHKSKSIFRTGLFGNKYLLGSIALGVLLQAALVSTPFLAGVFDLHGLDAGEWIWVAALSVTPLVVNEAVKLVKGPKK